MIGGRFVGRVVIVGQQVEKVQRPVKAGDVEAFGRVLEGSRNGHRDQKTILAGLLRLLIEGFANFLK
jgi:hypothetical protein